MHQQSMLGKNAGGAGCEETERSTTRHGCGPCRAGQVRSPGLWSRRADWGLSMRTRSGRCSSEARTAAVVRLGSCRLAREQLLRRHRLVAQLGTLGDLLVVGRGDAPGVARLARPFGAGQVPLGQPLAGRFATHIANRRNSARSEAPFSLFQRFLGVHGAILQPRVAARQQREVGNASATLGWQR